MSLRMSVVEIAHQLRDEIQERLAKAGVEVIEARISHLAYAPEIASAMLRRQQASAIIAARAEDRRRRRRHGGDGARSAEREERRANSTRSARRRMVSNLLVVLCSDRDAQPIVNAGTLYQ